MNMTTIEDCLTSDYGLSGQLSELYSYQDQSFLLRSASESSEEEPTSYVVKVMNADADEDVVDMQIHLLETLGKADTTLRDMPGIAQVIHTLSGMKRTRITNEEGSTHIVWVVSYLEGVLAADQQPYTEGTLRNLGASIAFIHQEIANVDHAGLRIPSTWKLIDSEWIAEHLPLLRETFAEHADWLESAIRQFLDPDITGHGKAAINQLPAQAIHGDINEHNVLFSYPVTRMIHEEQVIAGIIDFGDAHEAPRICDLAIAATYFMMHQKNPWKALAALVGGYHAAAPLSRRERELIMPLVRMRLAQSLTQSILRSGQSPDDDYITISQQPALTLIDQLREFKQGFATYWIHCACGDDYLTDKLHRLRQALRQSPAAPVLDADFNAASVLDLSPGSGHPADPFSGDMPDPLDTTSEPVIGRYGEPRLVYQSADFRASSHPASDARTLHAGVDVFMQAGTPVFAPCDAVVHALENRQQRQDYGPVIVLQHELEGDDFYTLYGHLDSECLSRLNVGDRVSRGQRIARIGAPPENGDWPPHLHFQWVLEDLGWGTDINGVCHPFSWPVWRQFFPNPAALLGCDDALAGHTIDEDEELGNRRSALVGGSLAVSYARPVQVVRGWQQYLYDQYGRCYLDAYNNVPHVGHCHPHVVDAVARQLRTLSTNTRYLHNGILDYADALTARFDERLSVCFIVNSASEANELALRLARSATSARDMIVMADAYHGHTTSLIDISPYKAEGPGGQGCPEWVHQVPSVDLYRGRYRYDEPNAGPLYANDVRDVIHNMSQPLCGFICESLPSVGGQLVYPPGYLQNAYAHVRAAGGVCIADEVQTGFGRTGDHFWGFEQQQADPDIVVLGKPIGNGFPLAAVITTVDIADTFNNGMEFFSTFGGNTVACAAGLAVLEVMDKENVQAHIKATGDYLKASLQARLGSHPLVGDIRGMGLFLGIELVTDKTTQTPATLEASYVKNRLRETGILIGTDGPFDSVLKIRPPSPFNDSDADFLVESLEHILSDTALRAT